MLRHIGARAQMCRRTNVPLRVLGRPIMSSLLVRSVLEVSRPPMPSTSTRRKPPTRPTSASAAQASTSIRLSSATSTPRTRQRLSPALFATTSSLARTSSRTTVVTTTRSLPRACEACLAFRSRDPAVLLSAVGPLCRWPRPRLNRLRRRHLLFRPLLLPLQLLLGQLSGRSRRPLGSRTPSYWQAHLFQLVLSLRPTHSVRPTHSIQLQTFSLPLPPPLRIFQAWLVTSLGMRPGLRCLMTSTFEHFLSPRAYCSHAFEFLFLYCRCHNLPSLPLHDTSFILMTDAVYRRLSRRD